MYHIQIVGAGYTGLHLVRYFREKKQKVWAITRTLENSAAIKECGATSLIIDLTRPENFTSIPPAHFIVIALAPPERTEAAYRKTYLEAAANYLAAIRKNPAPNLIVYLSSTGVYGNKNGGETDENTAPRPDSEKGKILLEAEEQILHSGFPAVIFRLGGIYGPGRSDIKRYESQCETLEEDSYVNRIHVEDIAAAMPVLFNKAEAGSIYLGVDDQPVLKSEFCKWLGERTGKPVKIEGKKLPVSGKRCSNKKLKTLGYKFKYPTYREGYGELISR